MGQTFKDIFNKEWMKEINPELLMRYWLSKAKKEKQINPVIIDVNGIKTLNYKTNHGIFTQILF